MNVLPEKLDRVDEAVLQVSKKPDAAVRRRSWDLLPVAVLAMVVSALAPWVVSRASYPGEPFDVSVIYRSSEGDIQYFPLLAQLARGTITDGTLKETAGTLVRPFPVATLLPHAISIAAFGEYGFVVADVLVYLAFFTVVLLLFRTVGISGPIGTLAALVIAFKIPVHLLGSAGFPDILRLWEMRIPRPFVSEVYLLATLVATLALVTSREYRLIHWIALGTVFGLLVQGDVHGALLFAVASPALIYCALRRDGLLRTLRGCVYGGLALALVLAPFVAQQLLQHPDIPVRWGRFPLDRRIVFSMFERGFPGAFVRGTLWPAWLIAQAAFLSLLLIAVRYRVQRYPDTHLGDARRLRAALPYGLALLVAAVVIFPVSILVLGSSIQPSHFYDRTIRIFSYVDMIALGVCVAAFAGRQFTRRAYLYAVLVAVLAVGLGYRIREAAPFTSHLRPQFFGYTAGTQPSYREAFAELTSFLDSHVPDDAVVATFDHQVYAWWLTFHRGYSFLADPFVSSAPDREGEARLALFCKALGMTTQEYVRLIEAPVTHWFWFSHQKYQAALWHTYAPLDDYTPEQRQRIGQTAEWWHDPIVPQSELRRLTTQFENVSDTGSAKRSMDVIVLGNRGPEKPWTPPSEGWELRFSNDGFRVYVPRSAAAIDAFAPGSAR